MVAGVFMADNLAAIVESEILHVFHNGTFHIGQIYQTGTRVDTSNCAISVLEVVSGEETRKVNDSVFSLNRSSGAILVNKTVACMSTCVFRVCHELGPEIMCTRGPNISEILGPGGPKY